MIIHFSYLCSPQDTCENVIEELLSLSEGEDSKLDEIVIRTSQDIIDDLPNADPRWANSDRNGGFYLTVRLCVLDDSNLRF